MNTLVAVAIAPFGVGDELAPYVAEAIRVIRDSGLTMALADQGIRTEVVLKADIRPGHTDTLHTKVEKVEELLAE